MSLVDELDLGRAPICSACLSFVAFPLADGDLKAAKREARRMTPYLWHEGLAEPALVATRAAVDRNVDGAREALADLEQGGDSSAIARAIVFRLAAEMAVEIRAFRAARRN